MSIKTIIVQAGGKGSRMKELTKNKPKALVSINGLPMLFHLFKRFPNAKYIVIGDYKCEVLEKYLSAFGTEYDYTLINANGKSGTCAGMKEALERIPDNERFMLIWCDLILSENFVIPNSDLNYVGISGTFPCRWKYDQRQFIEEKSIEKGVAGLFIFKNKNEISDIPEEGEFVRYLSKKDTEFVELPINKTHEYGLYEEWKKIKVNKCRPFNRLEISGNKVYKTPVDEQGKELAGKEKNWYRKMNEYSIREMPHIFSYDPFVMSFINGKNLYECGTFPIEEKKTILRKMIDALKKIHDLEKTDPNKDTYYDAYIAKTYRRLEKVRDLVPFANDEVIQINHKACKNIFYCKEEFESLIMKYLPEKFCLIHGDCTFSNTMIDDDGNIIFIDPRGYFGDSILFGDPAYDWCKLYYSLVSNYDQFNLKKFSLEIKDTEVLFNIESNQWEETEETFFDLLGDEVTKEQMKAFLAVLWLSLTTYAWDDYDSICTAFYNGLYYLSEVL